MTPQRMREIVSHYAAMVSGRNPEAIGALFSEDAVQTDPVGNPPNIGRAAIVAFFQSAVDASNATLFEVLESHTATNFCAISFRVTVTLDTGNMIINGIEVFEFGDDELIQSVTAYWDDNSITFS